MKDIITVLMLSVLLLTACSQPIAVETSDNTTVQAEQTASTTTQAEIMKEEEDVTLTINWDTAECFKVAESGAYPRVYRLSDGTYLCGTDGVCYKSNDGKNWSSGVGYAVRDNVKTEYGYKGLTVANTSFIELEDKTILAAYRAIGNYDDKTFYTKLQVSQSSDGGLTWKYHSLICEYFDYDNDFRGVWEPHLGYLNGILTCFYANDSKSVSRYQNIEYLQWVNDGWTNRTVVSDGNKHKSRDGMPVWQKLSDGGYVCAIEGWVKGTTELCIKLIYSADGISWSEPVTVYRAKNGSCGAPYVVQIPDDRLIISFQTNENTGSDQFRMMCIVSDGTPCGELTASNFTKPQNVFSTPSGSFSLWNGLYTDGTYLYACTGTNSHPYGILVKRLALK